MANSELPQTVNDERPPNFAGDAHHEWALRNRPFLETVFASFNRDGDWPLLDRLQRSIIQSGGDLDITTTADSVPHPMGFREAPPRERIVLLPLAMRYVDDAQPLLDDLARVIRLAAERYRSDGEGELVLRRSDLTEILGIAPREADKLSRILLQGVRFLGGGSGDLDSWERDIWPKGLIPLLKVETIDDYLAYEGAVLHPAGAVRLLPGEFHGLPVENTYAIEFQPPPVDRLLTMADLHPAVIEGCARLYADDHLVEAVEKGFKIVRDRLRELTGYERGSDAFGRGRLRVEGAVGDWVDDDFNEAVKYLTMAIDKFRNEKAHAAAANFDERVRAVEYLAMSSLAMRLLDAAYIADPSQQSDAV